MLNSRAHRLYSLTRSGSGGGGGGCDHVILDKVDIELNLANGDQTATVPNGASAKTAIIKKPETLTPANVRDGVNVAGVVGTMKEPTLLENEAIAIDFTDGDQVIAAPDGYAVKSAILLKPETLVPENIAKDVDIAGVVGTMSAGGGGLDGYFDGTIKDIYSKDETIRNYACYYNRDMLSVNLPNARMTGQYTFFYCSNLVEVNIPKATSIGNYAFKNCSKLPTVDFPNATSIGQETFYGCSKLSTVNLPNATSIGQEAFRSCTTLTTITLRGNSVCTLSNIATFYNTPIASGTGYIYVPASLKSQYESATNWSNYAAQFRALEDYTVDGTTTGALDPTKI